MSSATLTYIEAIEREGYAIIDGCLAAPETAALIAALEAGIPSVPPETAVRDRQGVYAVRNLLDAVRGFAHLPRLPGVRGLVEPILGRQAFLVKSLLFDKTPDSNWGVFWHQDLAIAVRARHDVPGFGAWTRKAGIVHVQPPAAILERMLTVRLNLDDTPPESGPLRVLPGSHHRARLSDAQTHEIVAAGAPVTCAVGAGGAVVMRPLLLHSSAKATAVTHRRVLHLEFAADDLPAPLEWFQREPIADS